jgi:hypothetical protein
MYSMAAMLLLLVWSGCTKDDEQKVRPRVVSTSPVNLATSVATNNDITATFSVEMDPETITDSRFTLQQGTTKIVGTTSYSGTTASFSPTDNLAPNTVYQATITTGAKNLEGTGLAKNYVWSFTTGAIPDIILPTVTLTNPVNNATGVAVNHQIVTTFSEPMNPSTIISSTYTVKQGTTSVVGNIVYTGNTGSFTPVSALLPNTVYTVTITTGVKDMAGNALAVNRVFSFTTGALQDSVLPVVISTNPLNNAIGVARNKEVSVNFSEAMNASTLNTSTFTLKQGTTSVSGTVSYLGTTATFIPSVLLAANTTYIATITTGAKDLAGNALASNTVWSFTTGAATSSLAPVVLGAAGNYVILAKSAVNNNPTSAVTGDIGLSPAATSFVTGFALVNATGYATSAQVTGNIYAADMAAPTGTNLTTAVDNMLTAYTDAAGRPDPDFSELATGNIGGRILTSGLYKWSNTVTLPSSVTISGGANDVWIFQIAGDLTMSNNVNITLNGGAQAKNIFWQVAGTVTIGTGAHFEGIILSQTGITFQTRASLNGRALAQTAVILDANAITKPQ